MANATWSENTITWNNKPESAANTSNPLPCNDGYQSLDAKWAVQQIVNGSLANHGFFIVNELGPTYQRTFFSRENGQEDAPKIHVFYSLPEETPSGQPADNGSSQGSTATGTTAGISAGTKAAPAAKTSAAIKPPSALVAKDAATAGTMAINLTWQKSETADIDGYKIFRSEKENDGFENIANADKNTLTYTDTVGDEKTYYYFVRAYKGSEESASSNTTNASGKKIIEEKAPITHSEKIHDWKIIAVIAGGLIVVAIAGILLYKFWWLKRKAKKEIK